MEDKTLTMAEAEDRPSINARGWWLRVCERRRLIVGMLFVGWAFATVVVWFIPAKYRSETVIIIEQQRVPEKLVEPNVAADLQQRLQSMSEQILSRTRLLGIIEKFHLYSQRHYLDPDALVETMRTDIGVELIKGDRPDQISAFKVSYSAGSPVVAQQVTAELTSLFIEENLRNREQLSEDTTNFLQSELDESRKNLDQQEQRLREFKNRYMGQLPDQTMSNLQILSGLQTRLQTANDALNQAEQQKLYLQSMLSEYRAFHPKTSLKDGATVPLPDDDIDQRLERMKSELTGLLAKYTPRHPDVVRLEQEIAATEKLKAQAGPRTKPSVAVDGTGNSLAVGGADAQQVAAIVQIESQAKANELDIANRKNEIRKIESDIESYQQRLNLTPAREQELAAITRDHDQSLANYESLLAKRNQSMMATNLEKRQQGEQFRMIDPPSLPQKPYFPKRLPFSLAGLAFGLAFGLAIVILQEFATPRLFSEEELRTIVAVPTVIAVPTIATAGETRKRRRVRLLECVAAMVVFFAIPAVTFLISRKG